MADKQKLIYQRALPLKTIVDETVAGNSYCGALLLGLQLVSDPMAVIAGAKLACSVTEAGGLGLIGSGYCDKVWIKLQLDKAKKGKFGIGFITWRLHQFPEVLTLSLSYHPKVIMLSFGDISPFVDTIKKRMCQLFVRSKP